MALPHHSSFLNYAQHFIKARCNAYITMIRFLDRHFVTADTRFSVRRRTQSMSQLGITLLQFVKALRPNTYRRLGLSQQPYFLCMFQPLFTTVSTFLLLYRICLLSVIFPSFSVSFLILLLRHHFLWSSFLHLHFLFLILAFPLL
jgi:hypothetical protein